MGLYQNVLESADGGVFVNLRDGSGNNISSTSNALNVYLTNALSIGVADESSFTYGTSLFQPVGAVYNSSITQLTSGQTGAFSCTAYRDLRVNLRTSAGVEIGNSNSSQVWVQSNVEGSVSGGTAGSTSALAGLVYNSSAPSLTNGQQAALQGDSSGNLKTNDINAASIYTLMHPGTGTLTQVTVSTSSASLLASNGSRKGMSVQNLYNKIIYLATGATASASAFTVAIQPNGFYECLDNRVYTGAWSVIGATGITGSSLAIVTEYT